MLHESRCDWQRKRMSSKRLASLSDYARHGYKLRLDCECGRAVLADPHTILRLCHERGWRHTLEGIALKLRCSKCGARPKRIGPALGPTSTSK